MQLAVNGIFYSIQTEAHHAGKPAVFIRLQGCSVGCQFCDSKNTWDIDGGFEIQPEDIIVKTTDQHSFAWFSVEELAAHVKKLGHDRCHVVITGGEPFEQDIEGLVFNLLANGHSVQIETSGTVEIPKWTSSFRPMPWITLSPKIGMPGGREIHYTALQYADEIKFPLGKEADLEILKNFLGYESAEKPGASAPGGIWLQPLSQNPKSTQICVKACMQLGWKLSTQVHKYIGLR